MNEETLRASHDRGATSGGMRLLLIAGALPGEPVRDGRFAMNSRDPAGMLTIKWKIR